MIQNYKIDPKESQLTVKTRAAGWLRKMGHDLEIAVLDFGGEIRFDPEATASSSVKIKISTASLRVLNVQNKKDLAEIEDNLFNRVLEAKAFPEILFESHQVKMAEKAGQKGSVCVEGPLVLRGKSQDITVEGQFDLSHGELVVRGELELKQTDFGIQPFSTLGGALRVKDEVQIEFSLLARC